MPLIQVHDLVVEFPSRDAGAPVRPLAGFATTIGDGELAVLLGPSGCGKTTLLSCIGGILRPTSGSITVDGEELTGQDERGLLRHRRGTVGFVFQAFNLIASLSALDNVAAPLRTTGVPARAARRRARRLLEQVGLSDRADHRPAHLSGGQQQRVAIARGLAHDPPLLLADEPTANLDAVQVESVLTTLRDLASPGRTVVVSTHDDRLLPIADRVVDLRPGRSDGPGGERIRLAAGEVLFEQGDESDLVYLIEEGLLEAVTHDDGGVPTVLGEFGAGSWIGELGPMMGQRRSATVRAVTEATVIGLSLHEFRVRSRGRVVAHATGGTR